MNWERFGEESRAIFYTTLDESKAMGEGYASTEHLLLGICLHPGSKGAKVISHMGVPLVRVQKEIERQLPEKGNGVRNHLGFTPRVQRAFQFASQEADAMGSEVVDSRHLLLGLIREGEGLAARVLTKLGIELTVARNWAERLDATEEAGDRPPVVLVPKPFVESPRNYSDSGIALLGASQRECMRYGRSEVTAEDLLLGLVSNRNSLASRVLRDLGIFADDVRTALELKIASESA